MFPQKTSLQNYTAFVRSLRTLEPHTLQALVTLRGVKEEKVRQRQLVAVIRHRTGRSGRAAPVQQLQSSRIDGFLVQSITWKTRERGQARGREGRRGRGGGLVLYKPKSLQNVTFLSIRFPVARSHSQNHLPRPTRARTLTLPPMHFKLGVAALLALLACVATADDLAPPPPTRPPFSNSSPSSGGSGSYPTPPPPDTPSPPPPPSSTPTPSPTQSWIGL